MNRPVLPLIIGSLLILGCGGDNSTGPGATDDEETVVRAILSIQVICVSFSTGPCQMFALSNPPGFLATIGDPGINEVSASWSDGVLERVQGNNPGIVWTNSDPSVFAFDTATGLHTAIAVGSSVVCATYEGFSDCITMTTIT